MFLFFIPLLPCTRISTWIESIFSTLLKNEIHGDDRGRRKTTFTVWKWIISKFHNIKIFYHRFEHATSTTKGIYKSFKIAFRSLRGFPFSMKNLTITRSLSVSNGASICLLLLLLTFTIHLTRAGAFFLILLANVHLLIYLFE